MKRIAPDKWKHFFVAIPMGAMIQGAGLWLWPQHWNLVSLLAFLLILAICYGFELFSKVTGLGHYDIYDVVAGQVGGVLGMAIALIIYFSFFY